MPLKLWYQAPASEPEQLDKHTALFPIGNGYMAALLSGQVESERLQFNEESLWTGGPGGWRRDASNGTGDKYNYGHPLHANAPPSPDELLAAMKNGSYTNDMMRDMLGTSDGYGSYQNFGWLDLHYRHGGDARNYRRELDLNTAVARVGYEIGGVRYAREYFASYPDRIIAVKISADIPGAVDLRISAHSAHEDAKIANETNRYGACMRLTGKLTDNGMKYAAYFIIMHSGGRMEAGPDDVSITGADDVTILFSAATDYKNEFIGLENSTYRSGKAPGKAVMRRVENAAGKGYDALIAGHIADHQALFGRVLLDIGGGADASPDELIAGYGASAKADRTLEELLFQYGRYLLIASSRPGTLPANLQGKWNLENEPPWSSDYHYNINLQMNYWPSGSTNLAECALPFIDFIESLVPSGEITARKYSGVDKGWTLHTSGNIFGLTAPGWRLEWGWSPANNAFICQNLWDYFCFSGDTERLKRQVYPIIKGASLFWANALRVDENDLVAVPGLSPEHGPVTYAAAYDQQLIRELFDFTIKAIDALRITEDFGLKEELAEKKSRLSPIEIGTFGQVMEWKNQSADYDDIYDKHHRHVSQLAGLYPGTSINRDTPELLEAAKVTLERRGDGATGWSMGWKINFWARALDGNRAYALVQNVIRRNIARNLFGLHEMGVPRDSAFQIDANLGYTAGVAEMLLQSHTAVLDILPALPDVWQNGKVCGLKARGGHEIDIAWGESELFVKIKAGTIRIGAIALRCPRFAGRGVDVTSNGARIPDVVHTTDVVAFPVNPGVEYMITAI